MRCPHCKNKVLQKSGTQTRVRVQGQITIDDQGVCRAQCYWCKSEIEIPLRLAANTFVESETFLLTK